jgi:4-hydroxy-tetrahydrodipicolinate synthase
MVTPFDDQGHIDFAATRKVVDFLLSHGVHGVMVGGSTGEGLLLTLDERQNLCEVVVDQTAGRIPVIAHTGCISTASTIRLTRHAMTAGATAAAIIVPFFFGLDDDSILNHYVTVANTVPRFPLFVYSFPGNAKNDITPGLLKNLRSAAPNIIGIKSTNPHLVRFQECLMAGGDGFLALNGVDGLMLPALTVGALGQVSGNANAFPEVFCALYEAFVAGDMERARSEQQRVNRIRCVLKDGFHPAFFKAVLSMRGIPAGRVRPPMRELTDKEMRELQYGTRALGLMTGW